RSGGTDITDYKTTYGGQEYTIEARDIGHLASEPNRKVADVGDLAYVRVVAIARHLDRYLNGVRYDSAAYKKAVSDASLDLARIYHMLMTPGESGGQSSASSPPWSRIFVDVYKLHSLDPSVTHREYGIIDILIRSNENSRGIDGGRDQLVMAIRSF